MSLISSAISAIRTRGLGVVLCAGFNHLLGRAHALAGRRFIKKRIYDYEMYLDLEDRGISRTLLLFGQREMEHKIILERVLKPGMTVLDIGCNIGYYALMELRLIGPEGTLIGVEPSESNVALARRNLTLNGYHDTEIHHKAISDSKGSKELFMSHMSNLNTFHTEGTGGVHLDGTTVTVEIDTVPGIMAGRHLDLIRMDVEGHEVEVLNGLLPAVERGEMSPMIIFETHLTRYGDDHDMRAPLERLFAAGYGVQLAGSSSERGTALLAEKGYMPDQTVRSDDVVRGVYQNISNEDAIEMICKAGGLRTVLLALTPDGVPDLIQT